MHKELCRWITKEHVVALARLDPKGKFEVCGDLIRARYGHNKALNISIAYEEDHMTETLYHSTS